MYHTTFSSCVSVQPAGNGSEYIHSGTSEPGGVLALTANSIKFCVAVPAPGQTWLVSNPDYSISLTDPSSPFCTIVLKDLCAGASWSTAGSSKNEETWEEGRDTQGPTHETLACALPMHPKVQRLHHWLG